MAEGRAVVLRGDARAMPLPDESVLGRHGISVDMSADYCRLAQWRTTDPGERARAMRVPKPGRVAEDQLSLFDTAGIG